MKIFDFNIHLYSKNNDSLGQQIKSDTELTANDLLNSFRENLTHFKSSGISAGNFMLFNSSVHLDPNLPNFIEHVKDEMPGSVFTLLFDFRSDAASDHIKAAKMLGFSFIKFHSYVQKISETDYDSIIEICQMAENLDMGICIDTSYGTNALYDYDNLKLAARLSQHISRTPIILLHSGGLRVMEASLIADLCPNIYMETSLSLDYYSDSSLQQDFAFAYKKLNSERVLYASDYPYQKCDDALKTFINFSQSFDFSTIDRNHILYDNAINMLSSLHQ